MSNKDTYEILTKELEEIVMRLRDESTSIDEALELYKKGKTITTKLEVYLQTARNELVKVRDAGKE